MKTKKYIAPEIEQIQLDNEISLILQSAPPEGPEEGLGMNTPDIIHNSKPFNV